VGTGLGRAALRNHGLSARDGCLELRRFRHACENVSVPFRENHVLFAEVDGNMPMEIIEPAIRRALQQVGAALSDGDARAVAQAWQLPGLVLADAGTRAIADAAEVEAFFAQAIAWYRSQGTVATRPEIQSIEPLSDKLAAVDVRWPGFNAAGREISTDTSHYIMQVGTDGEARICVALSRTR
jgi:hypothetical protein